MKHRLLLRVIMPACLLGAMLFAACVLGAWYVHRLEANLAHILSQNVASLEAAQELEIRARQLRMHTFIYLIEPNEKRLGPIDEDLHLFEQALQRAYLSTSTPEEQECVEEIQSRYRQYRDDMARLRAEVLRFGPRTDFGRLFDDHPIRPLTNVCHRLLDLNKQAMQEAAAESERISRWVLGLALLIGVGGPACGLLIGYYFARGLSSSIYRLSVRVQDMARRLDLKVASMDVVVDGDVDHLDRQVQRMVAKVEAVTARLQQHQSEMLRAEQLATVGQLAAGVAHEVRNPLTSVKMLVEAALRPQGGLPLTREDLGVIHEEVARLEKTVQGFLDYARPPTPQRALCDLGQVIGQAVDLVRSRARQQGVAFEIRTAASLTPAFADPGQLRTVLVNLLLNALDAMPAGGTLHVESTATGAGQARLQVSDSGPGIAADMLGRLFTPFASSKPTGTGLGLSISQRIVEDHGGTLTAENLPEGGACFTIVLPPAATEED